MVEIVANVFEDLAGRVFATLIKTKRAVKTCIGLSSGVIPRGTGEEDGSKGTSAKKKQGNLPQLP
jgi:hypothetical protein